MLRALKCYMRVGVVIALSLTAAGCRNQWASQWVNARVENQSGETIRQIEVDYPSASFGADAMANGTTLQYRFQIRGSGPIKIKYTLGKGQTALATGPNLSDGQQGVLTIRLLPEGKTEFEANVKPAS